MSEFDLSFNKYKNSILLNRLQYPFATASVSIHNYEYLYLIHFYSENDYYDIGLPVLKQTFSEYKSFFRELKSNITPTEFIFCLNEIRNRIDEVIEKIYKSNISEEYFNKYDFDYDFVIKYIDRYIVLFKNYNYDILYQYELELQKELFHVKKNTEEKYNSIRKQLEAIYFNEKYNAKENVFCFGGYEFGVINYIKQKDAKLFFETEIKKDIYNKHKEENNISNNYLDLLSNKNEDLINLNSTKTNEKIVMLYKLGIIDYLRTKEPFNLSTNKLASVLSAIIDQKTETIQSYLNPIVNKDSGQKNNPLTSSKLVEKVNQKLISIGYNPLN